MNSNPNITDNLSEIKESKAQINNLDIQNRIIEDIKEMDMDNLLALIEHMYPVKAIDINGCDIEISVDENSGLKTLNEIF